MHIEFIKIKDNRFKVYLVESRFKEGKRHTKRTLLKHATDFKEIKILAREYEVEIFERKEGN